VYLIGEKTETFFEPVGRGVERAKNVKSQVSWWEYLMLNRHLKLKNLQNKTMLLSVRTPPVTRLAAKSHLPQ